MLMGLRLENLSLTRGERVLFQGLDLELHAGEALALTGANGAGKTSLLRAVAGFIRPDQGQITPLDDRGSPVELEVFRARHLHWLGHLEGLKPTRTAGQELGFQCQYLGAGQAAMMRAVERLSLASLLDLECRKLSAGQRRRLSLARLVAVPRRLWLLDEPLAPLDEAWRISAGDLIADHLAGGGMVMAAVHDPLPHANRSLDLGVWA
jgi:heme exporter protein A